jgi:hypothetical protein
MAETKEGTPIQNTEVPPLLARPSIYAFEMPLHPLMSFSKKSPEELKVEAEKLQNTANALKGHWAFVFLGLGLTMFNYYRNIDTNRTLREIRNYVRAKKL